MIRLPPIPTLFPYTTLFRSNDYFTFSDTNIEYVWRMLKHVHERDWLYLGHRSTEWCPRCGTSISQHELIGSYVDRADPSLFVRFPLLDRPGHYVVVWTTTPWTLPANVAAAVHPDEEYGRRENGEWVAVKLFADEPFVERVPGRELVGLRYGISVDEVRPKLLAENGSVHWVPEYMGKRMDDWLRNMGDWNISRRRYYGLPLPFYPCSCGHLNVVGSKAELGERAVEGMEQLEELRRPWIDRVPIRCESCGEQVERIPEVGDVWLDAGIVPFSTLGWQNPEWVDEGYATGAARGLTTAPLPDHAYWEKWFPADWVSEMREQIRLWFYSQLFMSVVLTGRAPFEQVLGYEKMLDEQGHEMHGSRGNMI